MKRETGDRHERRGIHFPDSRIGASLKRVGEKMEEAYLTGTSPIRESGPH